MPSPGPQTSNIPSPREILVTKEGQPGREWYRYWRDPVLASLGVDGPAYAKAGMSVAYGGMSLNLDVNVTSTSNASSTQTDLMSYTLPASSMSSDGKGLRVTAWGVTANNANAKTLRVQFGSTELFSTSLPVSVAGTWKAVSEVIRAGVSSQVAMTTLWTNTSSGVAQIGLTSSTAAEDQSSGITVKVTGTGGAGSDITQRGQLVEYVNY